MFSLALENVHAHFLKISYGINTQRNCQEFVISQGPRTQFFVPEQARPSQKMLMLTLTYLGGVRLSDGKSPERIFRLSGRERQFANAFLLQGRLLL